MYARSADGYYPLPTDGELLGDVTFHSESPDEKKKPAAIIDYTKGDAKLDQLPFDPVCAFKIRLLNFANGAIAAINNKYEEGSNLKKIAIKKVETLVTKKIEELNAIRKEYCQNQSLEKHLLKILSVELNRFYAEDLPDAAGLTLQEIGLGESLYTWQVITRPPRITRHHETIVDSEEQKERQSNEEKQHLIIEQIEEPFSPRLTLSQKKELIKVHPPHIPPDWFTNLPTWAKHLLSKIIPQSENAKDDDWANYEKSHPTVLRRIPGAHTTRHRLVIKDKEGNILLETFAIRQGILTSFGMKNAVERQHSATENLRQVLSDQCSEAKLEEEFKKVWGIAPAGLGITSNPLIIAEGPDSNNLNVSLPILVCSLLTPGDQSNVVGRCIDTMGLSVTDSGDTGGTLLVREKNKACEQCDPEKKQITSLNFAVNAQRKVKKPSVDKFISIAKNFVVKLNGHILSLNDNPDKIAKQNRLTLLEFAITQLQRISSDAFEKDKDRVHDINKNIYRAALHDIIVRLIVGLPIIMCKSSKDRTGCEFIIADAILIDWSKQLAQKQELCFSAFNKERRGAFIKLVSQVYASGHQLLNAHDNSPGAPGIKDEGVLSQDIRKQLGPAYKTSKKLAWFNKPRPFWQKHRNKIWRWSMGGVAFLLGLISLILFCTGKLSPLGIVVGKAANMALSTAGCSLGGVGLTAAGCKIKEMYGRYKSNAYTFAAALVRIRKKAATVNLAPEPFLSSTVYIGSNVYENVENKSHINQSVSHLAGIAVGSAVSYYKKLPDPILLPPFGISSFAWRQCQRQSQCDEKNTLVGRYRP